MAKVKKTKKDRAGYPNRPIDKMADEQCLALWRAVWYLQDIRSFLDALQRLETENSALGSVIMKALGNLQYRAEVAYRDLRREFCGESGENENP